MAELIINNRLVLIISILSLFILIKFLLDKVNYFKDKNILKNIISSTLVIIVYFLISTLYFNNLTKIPKINFDKNLWEQKKEMRFQMVENLIESELLIGKNKEEVKFLIGNPKKISNDENKWFYDVRGMTWTGYKYRTIELSFEDDKVKSHIVKKIE